MKTLLHLTWSQHRMQKRFLSQALGVQCESEKSLRDERQFLLSGHLSTVMIKAKEKDDVGYKSSGGLTEVEVPVVYKRLNPVFERIATQLQKGKYVSVERWYA